MSRFPLLVPLLVMVVASGTLVTGCSSSRDGNVHARSAVASAKDSRQELVAAKAEIGKALADLDLIRRHGDLTTSFRTFSDDVEAITTREKAVRKQRERMEADSGAYIAQWQNEEAHYSSDDLRKSSIDRQAAVKQRFANVTNAYRNLEDQYKPFITMLTELQGSLSNDLTAASVDAIKPVAATAVVDGEKVQGKIDEVVAQLDSVISGISSDPAAAAAK